MLLYYYFYTEHKQLLHWTQKHKLQLLLQQQQQHHHHHRAQTLDRILIWIWLAWILNVCNLLPFYLLCVRTTLTLVLYLLLLVVLQQWMDKVQNVFVAISMWLVAATPLMFVMWMWTSWCLATMLFCSAVVFVKRKENPSVKSSIHCWLFGVAQWNGKILIGRYMSRHVTLFSTLCQMLTVDTTWCDFCDKVAMTFSRWRLENVGNKRLVEWIPSLWVWCFLIDRLIPWRNGMCQGRRLME